MKARRLNSLDVFRGVTIVGMIVVNAAMVVAFGDDAATYAFLEHAPWAGVTLADVIFPFFLVILGVAIPFALSLEGNRPDQMHRIFRRALILFLIGLGLNLITVFRIDADALRILGVLQRIALAYFFAALIYLYFGWRVILAVAAGVLILYWPLVLLPSPDGPANLAVPGQNFAAWFDRTLLGSHIYVSGPSGFDPEGILSTDPAVAQTLLGVLTGLWIRASEGARRLRGLFCAGLALTAAGLLWGLAFPMIKALWTSSYVLYTTGLALLLLAALGWLIDMRDMGPLWRRPFAAFGRNAILAYVLHILLLWVLAGNLLAALYRWAAQFTSPEAASLAPVAFILLFTWAVVAWLEKRGIRITV